MVRYLLRLGAGTLLRVLVALQLFLLRHRVVHLLLVHDGPSMVHHHLLALHSPLHLVAAVCAPLHRVPSICACAHLRVLAPVRGLRHRLPRPAGSHLRVASRGAIVVVSAPDPSDYRLRTHDQHQHTGAAVARSCRGRAHHASAACMQHARVRSLNGCGRRVAATVSAPMRVCAHACFDAPQSEPVPRACAPAPADSPSCSALQHRTASMSRPRCVLGSRAG